MAQLRIPIILLLSSVVVLLIGVNAHDPRFQKVNKQECPILKQEIDYQPLGRDWQLGNLSIYETVDLTPKRLLIAVYDIFGDTKNTRLFADLLAQHYGFRVIVPDFYRAEPWDHTKWPPVPAEYAEWNERVANWDTIVQYDVQNILSHYASTQGISEAGIFGFCWGGKISTLAATQLPQIKAAGLVHPSSVTNDMAYDVQAPMYLFPCLDDPDMVPFYDILREKFGENSGHIRYVDMCHGFATSMGNFSDPHNFQRVQQTIITLGQFFQRNLPNQ